MDVGHLHSSSEFINGENLFKAGPQVVTVSGARLHTFDNGDKVILSFEETEKDLTLNKTRHNFMVSNFTSETDNWMGQKIMLFAQQLTAGQFAGQYTILISKPMQQTAPAQPQPVQQAQPLVDDNIPF